MQYLWKQYSCENSWQIECRSFILLETGVLKMENLLVDIVAKMLFLLAFFLYALFISS